MKVTMRENEIELEPETDFERSAVVKLLNAGNVRVVDGTTRDRNWPPSPRMTNALLKLPDPNNWGL